ncbi:hypothetical protein WG66_007643 [Moniliophthora roreri]|nr:hypothetical protein WG66_007643 [Moniliophthora roreri]
MEPFCHLRNWRHILKKEDQDQTKTIPNPGVVAIAFYGNIHEAQLNVNDGVSGRGTGLGFVWGIEQRVLGERQGEVTSGKESYIYLYSMNIYISSDDIL